MEEFAVVNGEITFHNVRLIRRREVNNDVVPNNPGGGIGVEQPIIDVNPGGGIGVEQPIIDVNPDGGIGAEQAGIVVNPGGGIGVEQPIINVNPGGGIGVEQPGINANPGGGIGAEQPIINVNPGGGIGAEQPIINVPSGGIGAEQPGIDVNPGGGIGPEQPIINVNPGGGIGAEQPGIIVNPGGGIGAEQPIINVNPGGGIGAEQPITNVNAGGCIGTEQLQPDVNVNTESDEDDDGYLRHNDGFFGHSLVHSDNEDDVYIQTVLSKTTGLDISGKQSGPIETGKQTCLSKTTGLNISGKQSGPIETGKQTRLSKTTGLNILGKQSGLIEIGKQTCLSKTGKQPVRSVTGKQPGGQRDDDVEEILGKKRSSPVHKEKKRKKAKLAGGESHREESVQDRLKVYDDKIEHSQKCMRNSDFLRFQVGINIVSAIIVDKLPSLNHPITLANAERIYQDKAQVAFQNLGYVEWPNFGDVITHLMDDKSPSSLLPAFFCGPLETFYVVDESWDEVLKNADFHRDESKKVGLEKSAFLNQLAGSI